MQKKIIVLAIAAALTTPALAMAEASVYGLVDLSVDRVTDGAAVNSTTVNQLNSNQSRVGVKGSEDLGSGLSVVWQMESTVGMDTGNAGSPLKVTTSTSAGHWNTTGGSFFDRDTFIGLSSASIGTGVLGRHDTPYKMATRNLDVFADSAADNRSLMGMGVADARLSNVIAYISPSFSGLTVAGATTFGAETAANGTTKGSAVSLAGMYNQGPIYATLAYQTIKAGDNGTGDMGADALNTLASGSNVIANIGAPALSVNDKINNFKLGGSYTMDQFTVGAIYESAKITIAVPSVEAKETNLYLAGKFNISSTDAVKAAYTSKGATKLSGAFSGTVTDKATQIAIGYDHSMSKNTTVYALYTKQTWEGNLSDPSVLSAGIKHSF